MRRLVIVIAGACALGATFFQMHWVDSSMRAITVRASGVEGDVYDCLNAAREAKVRFEMRLCRRRSGWLDSCAAPRSENHSVNYDSISESYRVVSDRLDDDLDPVAIGMPSQRDAVFSTITAESVPLEFLARDEAGLMDHSRAYVQARAVFICKGSVNRTFAKLSQILTLGVVNVVESDSGWVDFFVQRSERSAVRDLPERR